MKKIILSSLAIVAAAVSLGAQNLNPEVRVTNDYVTRLTDVNKQSIPMSVPDSMTKFDYHFDYSVFDSPYKGAYEFTPYSVKVTPQPMAYDGSKAYLRLGAGYTLHPELEAVWAAANRKNFEMSVYADAKGFYGPYRVVNTTDLTAVADTSNRGYDFGALVGAEGRWYLRKALVKFNAGYQGIFTGLLDTHGTYNSAFASARVASTTDKATRFQYDLGVDYRFLYDINTNYNNLAVNQVFITGTAGQIINDAYGVLMDFRVGADGYSTGIDVTPKATFRLGAFDLCAGVNLAYVGKLSVHPDVRATVDLFSGRAQAYAFATGKVHYNSYSDLKDVCHRFSLGYATPKATNERLNACIGLRGSSRGAFQYDINAGYQNFAETALYALTIDPATAEVMTFTKYSQAYAGFLLGWKTERLDAQARFKFRYNCNRKDFANMVFAPSMLSGGMKLRYNWNQRLYLGLTADGESNRSANVPMIGSPVVARMPWYIDLGADAEYRFTHRLSFWVRGGNLLCMDIRQSPLYAEKGPVFTAGICLNLQ